MKAYLFSGFICFLLMLGAVQTVHSQPVFDMKKHLKKKEDIKRLNDKHLQGTLDANGYISLFLITDSIKYLDFAQKQSNPNLDKIYYYKGKYFMRHYDTAQAFMNYHKVNESKFTNDTYYCHLAQCYVAFNQYDSALITINKLLKRNKSSYMGLEVRSDIFQKTKKHSEAIDDLQKLVSYYFKEREDDIAISFYYRIADSESQINKRKGLTTLYKIARYYDGEGIAYERNAKVRIATYYNDVLGATDTALMIYDTINRLYGKQSLANVYEAHLEQGKLFWEANKFENAYESWMPCLKWYNHFDFLAYFERLAIIHPKKSNLYLIINYIRYNMAISGSKKEEFEKVILSATKLKVDKKYSSINKYLVGECYFKLTDFPNALKYYDKALKHEKDKLQKINLMYRKSQCYWMLKNEKAYRNQIKEVEKFKKANL